MPVQRRDGSIGSNKLLIRIMDDNQKDAEANAVFMQRREERRRASRIRLAEMRAEHEARFPEASIDDPKLVAPPSNEDLRRSMAKLEASHAKAKAADAKWKRFWKEKKQAAFDALYAHFQAEKEKAAAKKKEKAPAKKKEDAPAKD